MGAPNVWGTARTYHLPLDRVALCLDCDTCFDVGAAQCPACGGRMWALVARFLAKSLAAKGTRA